MPGQHTKTIEELEAELRACREQIAELTRAAAAKSELPHASRRAPGDPGEQPPVSYRPEALQLHAFKSLADHAVDGIAIADLDRRIYYANAAYREMCGFGDRTIGMTGIEFLTEGERERMLKEARPVLDAQRPWKGTARFRRPDGSTWLSQMTLVPLGDENNEPFAFLGIYRDVTNDVLREQALRESEVRHRALLDAIPDFMFVFSNDGVFMDYKAESDDQLLVPPAQFLGRRPEDVLPPDLAAKIRAAHGAVIRTRRMQFIQHSVFKANSVRWLDARLVPCGEDHVLMIARDVTEQKRAEEEKLALQAQVIAAQEEALRALATPVVPIAEGVLAIPLIGAIDAVRAQQILEVLLEGIAAQRVRIAILDITGVKVIGAETASALIKAAQAARLLGAQVVLTGIGPTVARALVELNADLGGIVTYGTLQAGIAHALK
jgi:rsbT co-antagonist protein RsbR